MFFMFAGFFFPVGSDLKARAAYQHLAIRLLIINVACGPKEFQDFIKLFL